MASQNSNTDEYPVFAAEEEVGESSYTETRDQYALVHLTESNDLEVSDPIIVDDRETNLQATPWIRANYILEPGHTVSKRNMYEHYRAYCTGNELQPVNSATFGKSLRAVFPDLKTKRLGPRRQSQYHYDGIRERNEDERNAHQPAVNSRLSLSPVRRGSSSPRTHPVQSAPLNIPKFNAPSIPSDRANQHNSLIIPFTTTYERHCQEIFDMVSSCQVECIQTKMHTFYQASSPRFQTLVHNTPELIDAIWRWDSYLYDFMINTFFRLIDSPLSTDMRRTLETYATGLERWQETCLMIFPEMLYQKKTDVARIFSAKIDRQLSLNYVAQNASSVLADYTQFTYMRQAWGKFNFDLILDDTSKVCRCDTEEIRTIIRVVDALLNRDPKIEHWKDWVSTIVDKYLGRYSPSTPNEDPQYVARSSQLQLKSIGCGHLITHGLSLQQPEIYDPFHKLYRFLCQYLKYLIEESSDHAYCTLMGQLQQEQTQQGLQQNSDPSDPSTVETAGSRNDSGND